jgi:hypothetical protein
LVTAVSLFRSAHFVAERFFSKNLKRKAPGAAAGAFIFSSNIGQGLRAWKIRQNADEFFQTTHRRICILAKNLPI